MVDKIEEVLISIRRVIRATDLHSKHLAKTTGLTTPQLLLLQTIRNKGKMSSSKIAEDISLSQATVTSIVDRLEKKQLVYKERCTHDQRKIYIHLTTQAQETLKESPVPLQESFTCQFTNLLEWEQTMMISSLQRVAQMMDAQDIDASPVLDVGLLDRQTTNIDKIIFSNGSRYGTRCNLLDVYKK